LGIDGKGGSVQLDCSKHQVGDSNAAKGESVVDVAAKAVVDEQIIIAITYPLGRGGRCVVVGAIFRAKSSLAY
jgi:hypothetical protein